MQTVTRRLKDFDETVAKAQIIIDDQQDGKAGSYRRRSTRVATATTGGDRNGVAFTICTRLNAAAKSHAQMRSNEHVRCRNSTDHLTLRHLFLLRDGAVHALVGCANRRHCAGRIEIAPVGF
jgi:hypothetical protein